MKKIILASGSLRRKDLLNQLGIPFEVIESNVEEVEVDNEYSPYEWVKAISSKKSHAVLERVEGEVVVIGADTIVTDLGTILHRPRNKQAGIEMMEKLQGRKHTVYTGLSILYREADGKVKEENFVDATDVYMNKLSYEEIEAYMDTDEPYDKAGGYGIQGKGALLIESIYGDYYTVVGLPLGILYKSLKENGINLMEFWKK